MKKIFVLLSLAIILTTGCSLTVDTGDTTEDEKKPVAVTKEAEPADDTVVTVPTPTIAGVEEPTFTEQLNTPREYDSDTTIIENYYAFLGQGRLEDAYALKYETKTTYATFKGWYSNTASVKLRNMEDLGKHRYRFIADLVNDDESEESYKVTMEVIDGKLKTESSVAVPDKSLRLGTKNGYEYLYLSVKGEEELVVKHYINEGNTYESHIRNYKLFEDNKYISYDIEGLGMQNTYVYKISAKKTVVSMTFPLMYGFTDDEKFFYACQATGLYGGYMNVYKVSATSVDFYKSLDNGTAISNCYGYNKDRGYFEYEIEYSYDPWREIRRYYYFGEDVVR